VLVDKPAGMTSHDVVARVRRLAGTKKVGHAGTLDPMATGLLVLGINSATKLLTFVVGEDKTYLATIRLGAATVTDDAEGDFIETDARPSALVSQRLAELVGPDGRVVAEPIKAAVSLLTGEILQVPSSVSAIKVDGERAYALVRGGDTVKLKPRPVTVSRFEVLAEPRVVSAARTDSGALGNFIDLDVIVDCSSGTYIRALARDLGEALGVGGHLTALRRTRIGGYDLTMAQALPTRDEVASLASALPLGGLKLEPLADAAQKRFATRSLSVAEVIDLRHGKRISVISGDPALAASKHEVAELAAIGPDGELVGILTRVGEAELKSVVVFADA
jgi:tRNA pseudouridine55 synthase